MTICRNHNNSGVISYEVYKFIRWWLFMSGKELWELFVKKNDIAETDYEEFAFGDDSDLLAYLVKIGEKTATASAYPLYELEDEPLPKVGSYSVVLDSKDNAVCIIQTTKVSVVPFNEISKEHAYKEGEGDKSLDYWKRVYPWYEGCVWRICSSGVRRW